MKKTKSSAQLITKIGYTEETRNLHFLSKTEGLEDAKKCVEIIDRYNDFDQKLVNQALEEYANYPRYYGPDNRNNGQSLVEIHVGRESSPCIYIKLFRYYVFGGKTKDLYTDKKGNNVELTAEDFEKNMKLLGQLAKADECMVYTEAYQDLKGEVQLGAYLVCRMWWD